MPNSPAVVDALPSRWPSPLLWFVGIFPLLGFWLTGLFDLDEGFYAAVTGEMNRRGEWITPFFNGKPWFEKPILLYWLAKPCVAIFGDMVGPRLPSVLCMVGLYAALYRYGQKYICDGARVWIVAATSLYCIVLGRLMMTDAPMALCLTLAFLLFWDSLNGQVDRRIWSAFFLGLSVLAKGPVGCAFFVLVIGILYYRVPALRPKFRGRWLAGTLVFAVTVAAWYLPCYLQNGQMFVDEFLIKQNVGRFTGGDAAHSVPLFPLGLIFYAVCLVVLFAPWWFWVVPAFRRQAVPEFIVFCRIWAAVILIFFTLSGSKLPHYILPALPPLAILVAYELRAREKAIEKLGVALAVCLGVFANWGLWFYYNSAEGDSHAVLHGIAKSLRSEPGQIAIYQMSRRELDRGTGKADLKETSHPSVLFYLNRVALDTDDMQTIQNDRSIGWIISRANRISQREIAEWKRTGFELTPTIHGRYAVFRVDRRSEN